jgi:preprotein translocase subunit SecY
LGCWGVGVLGQETETTKRSWQSDRYVQLTEHGRALAASLNRSVRLIPNARPVQNSPLLKQVLNRVPIVSGDL